MPYRSLAALALAIVAPVTLAAQQAPATPNVQGTPTAADSGCVTGTTGSTGGVGDTAAVRRCGARPAPLPGPFLRPRLANDRLVLARPAPLSALGSMRMERPEAIRVANQAADSIRREAMRRAEEVFRMGANERLGWAPAARVPAAVADATAVQPALAPPPASPSAPSAAGAAADRAMELFGDYADLGLVLNSRLETKLERNRNERCTAFELVNPAFNCSGTFQPQFDFQFNVRTGGVVADRIHVNVDYDSQREFDASNNINVYYEGKSDELIERLEVGNVTFSPTSSRFITGGIPSGNYGLQAKGQLGPMRFSTIVAQQKGNRVNGRAFEVGGDGTLQTVTTDLEDFRFEQRRFFWVVDPMLFGDLYPNIDILNASQLRNARDRLAPGVRPSQVRVYRWRADAPTFNAQAPRFRLLDAPPTVPSAAGVPYELLTPGQDYYIDPSQLWFVLVRPVSNNERVVLAYTPETGTPDPNVTGTPDLELVSNREQTAILVYSSEARVSDPVFLKEIRNVYRIGGEDLRRESVTLRIGTQAGGGQEVPTGGTAQTFLQMLGLAQASNSGVFDVENRLWPRPGDPVQAVNGGGRSLFSDRFLVMPSARPFASRARGGRIEEPNVPNDTIYTIEPTVLNSVQRPAARYFLRATFQAQGGGEVGSLMLGSVQVSRNSERLSIDGVPLQRGSDYEVDYELGRVTFLRPDTLFRSRRQVMVQYEENPLFAAAPTSVFGIASQLPFQNGQLNFVAISQNQRTAFNRPPLGFEPASSLVAGVSGNFQFDAAPLSRFLERMPTVGAVGASTITVGGEIATSRPQPNSAGVAYVESFEGEGGVPLPLAEGAWYYGSVPSAFVQPRFNLYGNGRAQLDTALAATLAWQNTGVPTKDANSESGFLTKFLLQEIDPQVKYVGNTPPPPEQVLWLTLYPANVGGYFTGGEYQWRFRGQPTERGSRRWRSLRTVLSPTGADLSRTEYLEFWALVDPSSTGTSGKNPVLVVDLGEISENSLAFVPETVTVVRPGNTVFSNEYRGRKPSGLGRLHSERDSLTNQFDVTRNDVGLPSDVAETIVFKADPNAPGRDSARFTLCRAQLTEPHFIGNSRANCTVRNNRLEEEDINLDRSLNEESLIPSQEQIFRWVIDLNDRSFWVREGFGHRTTRDRADGVTRDTVTLQWQLIRVPINDPHETIGDPVLRRVRAMRLTMIAGGGTEADEFTQTALARLRFVGSPWLKRNEQIVSTLVGSTPAGGRQIAGIIGTQDATDSLPYEPPPGVVDAPETRQGDVAMNAIQINERSIRILASGTAGGEDRGWVIPLHHRAEAYFRFPEGQKNFMGYRELRVWARGRGKGWSRSPADSGDLEFFIKIGRDPNNFYLFRRDAREGPTRDAWTDVRVRFERLYRLRSQVQNQLIQGQPSAGLDSSKTGCTAADRAMFGVADDGAMTPAARMAYWACVRADSGTYMLYTESPNTSAPNLAQVQELAVGMLRTRVSGTAGINTGDQLELWADDIRLTGVVDDAGYAGELAIALNAGDVGRFAVSMSRRDANFRQLGEAPSYLTDNAFAFSTSFQLDRFVPGMDGWSVPVTFTTGRAGQDPYFLAQQDVLGAELRGLRTPRSSSSRYGVSLRRSTPTNLPYVGALVDNLILDATLNTADGRDNYTTRGSRQYDVNASYAIQAQARSVPLPAFITGAVDRLPAFLRGSDAFRSLRQARFRWNPSAVRFSSGLSRSDTRTTNYIRPAVITLDGTGDSVDLDPGRLVTALNHVWNNTAGVELRPFGALSATWNFSSLRDLRHYERDVYNDSINVGAVAAAERDRAFGVDVGLERERRMNSAIAFQPVVSPWLRPRAELASTFSYLRDPNTRQVVLDTLGGDGVRRLPRRLNNSQVFSTGLALDLGRALLGANNSSARLPLWRRALADAIQPVDLSFTRTYQSAFDGTPFTPGLDYQFGLGGFDNFLGLRDQQAASAGLNNAAQLRAGLSLPLGFSLQQEMRRSFDRTYYRVSDDRQLFRENTTRVLPRVSVGWNYRPKIALVAKVFSNISANAGWEPSETEGFAPALTGDSATAERSLTVTRAIPVRASVTWAILGDLTTTGTYRQQTQKERRPGAYVLGDADDMSISMSRGFRMPKSWNLSDQVMTSVAWQQQAMRRYLPDSTGGVAANQASNGRKALSFNADTQLAENLLGSLVMSRVVNYDNVTNRRFNQFVLTAVFQLTFQAGQIR